MNSKLAIFVVGGFVALSAIAAATGNFAMRLEQASQQAQSTAQANRQIAVERINLIQGRAAGFRQFQQHTGVVAPGASLNIYFEPTNLATRFESGAVRAAMTVDVLVRNARGETVAAQDGAWQLPIVQASSAPANLTQTFGDLTLNPLNLPDGRYQIVLRFHDDFNQTFVDRVLDFEMRRTAAAASPRLSQAAPAR